MTVNHSTTTKVDEQLKRSIDQEWQRVPGLDSTHIGVIVDAGTATLFGEVDSYPERQSAADAALRIPGVNAVAQEITVRSLFVPETDAHIAQLAGQILDRMADVPDTVRVTVTDHHITLTGSVRFAHQVEAAGRAMHHIRAATGILNEIQVLEEERPADRSNAGQWSHLSAIPPGEDGTTSTYESRLSLVEDALKAEKVHPAEGKTLAQAAATVLAAIDEIRGDVR